ncbi:antithrombin-iii-like protein [Lasius niger]|uniref:Antithrombin-iii-like protein n=1 Tax=Lasius niger TaxID=67767 RepID=A0A0J7MP91_LASNI|nr:antithrombin-iii-like protein [Lasius niger]
MNDIDPNVENICDLIDKLSTEERISKLRDLLDSDTTQEDVTNFSIWPIFEVEKNLPIRELLRVLGIEELLKPDAINLYCSHKDDKHSLHLGNAVHRTHVKVTQGGTMACSATVFYTGQVTSPTSQLVVPNNRPNYPFIWLIYDKVRRNVLFVGAFNDFPDYSSPIIN